MIRSRCSAGSTPMLSGPTGRPSGASRALGVNAIVSSPTFTIGQRYPGPVPVAHVDLFRVGDLGSEDPDLLDEYLRPDTIASIDLLEEPAGKWMGSAVRSRWASE